MGYFKHFPVVIDYEIDNKIFTGIDITRRTDVVSRVKADPRAYIEYSIKDGETPEIISDRVYDDENLYWVIMMFNDIFDVNADWPLDQHSFDRFVTRKYGVGNEHKIHHYESIASGSTVCPDWPLHDIRPVTNYEHELTLNDKKRDIKVPLPEYAAQISSINRKLIKR